jgi:alkanesulfonate monooxygenase SsuD/methylene tetrahydromethanopterin reductase-like flavin-dependent oxidoreductase (luciferase family)
MTMFGFGLMPSAAPGADPVEDAVRAERFGFDFVSMFDHPCGTDPTYETWTLLTWIAAATTRINLGPRVLGVPYRPPAMVAKMAESLDRLSGGRLFLGLGGGSSDEEFRAFGLTVPSPRDKVDGMAEAVEIARGLWSQPAFTYSGRIYRTEAADIAPMPERRIPVWLGTFGPRALAVTGRLADGWIPSYGLAPPDKVVELRDQVLTAAEQAGRSADEITLAYHIQVRVAAEVDPDPSVVVGPADYVAERLARCTALGFTALSLVPIGPGVAEQTERLANEVIPSLT